MLGTYPSIVQTSASLTGRIEMDFEDCVVVVFGGMTMTQDDSLETRIDELAVHADVAAAGVGDRPFVLGSSRAERAQRPLAF